MKNVDRLFDENGEENGRYVIYAHFLSSFHIVRYPQFFDRAMRGLVLQRMGIADNHVTSGMWNALFK